MMAGARQRTRQRSSPPSLNGSPKGWRVAGIINAVIIAEAIARAGACFDQMGSPR
jgi:anti-sigma-K factor RskA